MSKKTISDKLSEILTIKEEIKDSISNKEVDIDDNTPFRQYPSKINSIKVGKELPIDTEMSDESENAVQNKVIKKYVDDSIPLFDETPTQGSDNAVKSKGIKAALDDKADVEDIPITLAELGDDETHRLVTDSEKAKWNAKANAEDVPKKVSELENDSKFVNEEFVKQQTSKIYKPKGSVKSYDLLPQENEVGDVYNVEDAYENYPAGTNFVWTEEGTWDALGGIVDLSGFLKIDNLKTVNGKSLVGQGNINIETANKLYKDASPDSYYVEFSENNELQVRHKTPNEETTENLATEKYVDNKVSAIKVPTKTSDLENDSNFLTDVKTINTQDIKGSGNLDIDHLRKGFKSGQADDTVKLVIEETPKAYLEQTDNGSALGPQTIKKYIATEEYVDKKEETINGKLDNKLEEKDLKTINGNHLVGSGDIEINTSNAQRLVRQHDPDTTYLEINEENNAQLRTQMPNSVSTKVLATEDYVNNVVENKADKSEIPTDVSELNNDSGYLTKDNLKTINGNHIDGSGNIEINTGVATQLYQDASPDSYYIEFNENHKPQVRHQTPNQSTTEILATENYVDNKFNAVKIPTKVSDLENDSDFAEKSYVDNKLTSVYKYKGSFERYEELPKVNEVGDVYNVEEAYGEYPAGTNYAWTAQETWDALSGSVDLTAYIKKNEVSAIGKSGNLADAIEDDNHKFVSETEKNDWNNKQNALTFDETPLAESSNPVKSSGIKAELDKKANTSDIPTKVSTLENDSGYLTKDNLKTINGNHIDGSGNIEINTSVASQLTQQADPDTYFAEFNESHKLQIRHQTPNQSTTEDLATENYVNNAVKNKADRSEIPTELSQLQADEDHRFVSDTEKETWNNKANAEDIPTAVSDLANDLNFINKVKTVDGQSIVGSGNININNAKQLTKTSGTDTITVEINDSNKAQVKVKTPNQETVSVLASEDFVKSQVSAIKVPVESVNGKTGAVTITKEDLELENVENTADLDKPISKKTQSALDLKANKSEIPTDVSELNNDSGYLTKDNLKTVNGNSIYGTGNVQIDTSNAQRLVKQKDPDTVYLEINENGKAQVRTDYLSTDDKVEVLATEDFVNNGLNNKANKSDIKKKTSELTNDSNFVDKSYVDNKLTSVYKYKGSVKSYDLLPLENEIGDVYNVEQAYGNFPAGTNFAWTSESTWDGLSGSVDLSAYIKTAEVSQIGKTGNLADANDDTTHRWVSDTEKNTWNGKQNALSFDNSPMADSSNPVKSSGIKTALDLKADKTEIPTALSQLTGDTTHRVVTDTEKTKWNNKADTSDIPTSTSNLTNDSGFITSVKTVDGQSIVGSGNININNAKQLTKTSGTDTITVEINDSNKAQVKVKTPNQETIKVLASEDYVDSAVSSKANKNDIPTKTSDLNNDSSFITSSSVDSKISTATTNLGKLKIGTKWYTASLSGTQLTLTSS